MQSSAFFYSAPVQHRKKRVRWADLVDPKVMSSRRQGRPSINTMASRDSSSSADEDSQLSVTVKAPPTKLRQAAQTTSRRTGLFEGGEIVHGKRNRGGKKSYIVDSSPDEDEDEEEEEIEVDDDDDDNDDDEEDDVEDEEDDEDEEEEEEEEEEDQDQEMGEEDAEGEEEMEVDAEGEEDAEGDTDVDIPRRPGPPPVIKVSRSTQPKPVTKPPTSNPYRDDRRLAPIDDDDDDDLSDPAESDLGDETMGYGDETMGDEDAEGEEIEVAVDEDEEEEDEEEEEEDEEEEEEEQEEDEEMEEEEEVEEEEDDVGVDGQRARRREAEVKKTPREAEEAKRKRGSAGQGRLNMEEELDSDDDIDIDETPDLAKMTKRQRARFEDAPQEYMKLSDEIQVKKVFTAEELSMRRQEMARRRRNLSEKRTEEVKMETINKLLKKQAPKVNRKAAAAAISAAAIAEGSDNEAPKPNPLFIRWVSNKSGSQVSIPGEIMEGPVGRVFGGKMVEEVA